MNTYQILKMIENIYLKLKYRTKIHLFFFGQLEFQGMRKIAQIQYPFSCFVFGLVCHELSVIVPNLLCVK